MKKETSSFAGVGAAILAILGSITCCGAPIVAGILASIGIGASQLQFLNAMQPYLIGIALLSLLIGFYRLYFNKNTSCCNKGDEQKIKNKNSKRFLWLVTIITLIMLGLTYNVSSPNSKTPSCGCSESSVKEKMTGTHAIK